MLQIGKRTWFNFCPTIALRRLRDELSFEHRRPLEKYQRNLFDRLLAIQKGVYLRWGP